MDFVKLDSETGIYHFKLNDGSGLELCSNGAFDTCAIQHESEIQSLITRLKDAEEKLERAVEWIKNAHKKDCYFMKPYTFKDNPKCDCKKNNFLKSLNPEPLPKENS